MFLILTLASLSALSPVADEVQARYTGGEVALKLPEFLCSKCCDQWPELWVEAHGGMFQSLILGPIEFKTFIMNWMMGQLAPSTSLKMNWLIPVVCVAV